MTVATGGITRYTCELARALASEFPEDQYTFVSDQPLPGIANRTPANFLERRWWLAGLARELYRARADCFHGTDFTVPYLPLRPSVLTLHDLSPWKDPAWCAGASRVRRRTPALLGLGVATMVVTPSAAVRREALDRFNLPPSRVVAVPLGSSFQPVPVSPTQVTYFLYVGTVEPRKNLPMLVAAWRQVRRRHNVDLVLAGRLRADGPRFAPEPGLHLLGPVREAELPRLYSGALAFVYPSLYEGFGLPVLEAMQCGVPVFASRLAAIEEVAGEAANLLPPGDATMWVEALDAAARNPEHFAPYRARALARGKLFTWQATARNTREVYKEAMRRF